nr:hypothetical protein BaRGS_009859 [Batillaria attramentaria]
MWRLEQILMRQYTDKGEQLRLLEHAREIVKDTSQPITRQWNEQLLHNFVSVVPVGDEEEMANRGLIQALLDDGVDISMVDSSGDSPLLKAVKVGNRVAVDLLLRAQCDVNVKDRYGRTCLIYAAYMKDEETIKHLLQLRKSAIKMDLSDSTRYTALAYAASSGKIGICRLLLDAGANPNASSEVVTLLLKFDASFNKTWHRNQAFLSALQRDHVDVLTVFMEHGLNLELPDKYGKTAFYLAAEQGHKACMELFTCALDGVINQWDYLDGVLLKLDIVAQNYISSDSLQKPAAVTEVEHAAFDAGGDWLVTYERWDDGKMTPEHRLKFWHYNTKQQKFVEFGGRTCSHLIVTATDSHLTVWNLISMSVHWRVPLSAAVLLSGGDLMAVLNMDRDLFVFSPNKWQPIYQHPHVSEHPIVDAIFLPQSSASNHVRGQLSWQQRAHLYLFDTHQQLFTLEYSSVIADRRKSRPQAKVAST